MEISHNSHFTNDAYLLSQQKNKAEQSNVTPIDEVRKEQGSHHKRAVEAKEADASDESKNSASSAEQNKEITTNTLQPINITKARQASQSNTQQNESSYKVTAHDPQMARHAKQAVESYNHVENSQYGQELVNRIELMV